jgi:hypothetical protein
MSTLPPPRTGRHRTPVLRRREPEERSPRCHPVPPARSSSAAGRTTAPTPCAFSPTRSATTSPSAQTPTAGPASAPRTSWPTSWPTYAAGRGPHPPPSPEPGTARMRRSASRRSTASPPTGSTGAVARSAPAPSSSTNGRSLTTCFPTSLTGGCRRSPSRPSTPTAPQDHPVRAAQAGPRTGAADP